MIDRATVDRILDAVRIEDVIGDFVSLKRRGANYLGLCPFHQDKNPSMSVSPTRGIFKCFSCGKAGTAITFVMDHEHLTYPEALRYLAKKYGIDIVEKEETAEEIANRLKYESLLVVSEYAQKFYQNILWNNEYGRAIGYSYFKERQFSDETIRKFGLGYAHNRPLTLASEALKNGYKKEFLIGTGLCIERDNGDIIDRFYDRVMFPIHSISGRVIAFGGRTLKSDKTVAKYVNSPETEIYNKSRSLYGIFFAKSAIAKSDKCYLVEGYADVISMHQAGIENVVASSGTSLTVEQIRLIKRFTNKITILYDGDDAGIKASVRGIDLILEEGMQVKIVLLPPEDDPDSYAKAHSKDEILDYIENKECDFISYKSELLSKDIENDPLKKAQMINDIIASIAVVPDPILRNVYVEMVAEKFDQKPESIFLKIKELRGRKKKWNRPSYNNENYLEPQIEDSSYSTENENVTQEEAVGAASMGTGYDVTNSFLAVHEREIVYYLIKFGCYDIHFEKDMEYGNAPSEQLTVAEYIISSMRDDELEFENPLYREIYNSFYLFLSSLPQDDCETNQKKVIRYLSTGENQAVSNEVLNLICEEHPLTIQEYKKSIVPEEHILGITVPKSMLLYKLKVTEQKCMSLLKEIEKAQKSGDKEMQKELIGHLQILNQVKNRFAKELNRL
ncbi:MAG: DNA primase [Bacteroidales bacterium]|nr:DNA primase [Bacteroidales bacterium]MDD4670548.1 DNA primase [Bacteroidales bacterium]